MAPRRPNCAPSSEQQNRTGSGITKLERKIAEQAAISAFAAEMFNLSGAPRDRLVAWLVGAAFDDHSISDRDVRRLRSGFLDKSL